MFIGRVLVMGILLIAVENGCRSGPELFSPLTHSVAIKNAGRNEAKEVWLEFGELQKIGWLPPNIEKVVYRTGTDIPAIAAVSWRRGDNTHHESQVRVETVGNSRYELRYHIEIHDEETLSCFAEELKDRPRQH